MSAAACRILIVDDSREDRLTFRRYLEADKGAYLVSEAGSGSEGLARCRSEAPDCVLLDYNLPDVDGVEFLEQLRQELGKDAPAVVMLTGQGSETLAVKALKKGAEDYLVKGFAKAGVSKAIQNAVANVVLRRSLLENQLKVEKLSLERGLLLEQLQARAAQLGEADRRKDQFLATLAHELRNPLAAISNSLHVLQGKNADAQTSERMLSILGRQFSHMVRLVDDLMEVSRITRGNVELRLADVDLASVLQSALETSKPLLDAGEHRLQVSLPETPMRLRADATRLTQVFANLLNNAAKYTEKGGSIWLTASREGHEAVVSVRDSGTGIPGDMLPKVFELFTQINRTLGRAQGGLGIGLMLAKQLSELHAGRIEVRSEGIDKGSEFIVRLPLLARPTALAAPGNGEVTRPAGTNLRVLVVDDNQDAAESLGQILRMLGFEPHVVHDGASAIAACRSIRPAMAILDIGMPMMDGYEAARRIRELGGFDDLVLVALTGWGQEEDRSRSDKAGFDHHLIKPVEVAVLQKLLGV